MRLTLPTLALLAAVAFPADAADRAHPTVVELFQSQGCSSCPPADLNLNALADRPDILALNFSVTYWDQLGWKDTFAKPGFTARQWDYAHAAARGNVSTPQVIVNGRGVVVGNDRARLDQAIGSFDRGSASPEIAAANNRVTIGAGAGGKGAMVWLVRYDPRRLDVPIGAGENGGRTLPHRNIVRSIDLLGRWTGTPAAFALPTGDPVYRSAILLQAGRGGPIISAAKI